MHKNNKQFAFDVINGMSLEDLQDTYGKPKDERSLKELRRYYVKKYNKTVNDQFKVDVSTDLTVDESLDVISKLFKDNNIDPKNVAEVQKVRIGSYQQVTKDEDGESHVHDLEVRNLVFRPKIDVDASFISKAAPTIIKPTKKPKPVRDDTVTMCFGDAQIGFWKGEPFHDERAMDLVLQAVAFVRPDNIVLTGDMIDLPSLSKYTQYAEWQHSTQASIDTYHNFLARLRATAPDAKIVVVHGNHELRMDKHLRYSAAEFFGIRRANADEEFPVLSLQYLVRYEDLGIIGVDGYPNADYWLEDDIRVTHGTFVKKGGSNAAKYLQEDYSTIFGHTHRLEVASRTIPTRYGSRTITAGSPGCLAKVDGTVPGFHFSTDEKSNIVKRAEDWQQGALIVTHNKDQHDITLCRIDERGINVYGQRLA